MDEVARRQGTVHLDWPSKADLFGAVLTRDAARPAGGDAGRCYDDRCAGRSWRRWPPAWPTGDVALLGELMTTGTAFARGNRETTDRYLAVLHKHGLPLDRSRSPPQ